MVRVKICGITCPEDAISAVEAGADFLGFVFYPPSTRFVTPETVSEITSVIRHSARSLRTVGVFVDEDLDRVQTIIRECGLDYAQLCGTEPPEYVAALEEKAIKALRVTSVDDLRQLALYRAAFYHLDSYHPTKPGGTGLVWDWSLAVAAKQFGPIILAGGLTPTNVAGAIREVHPYAVDVSSGVESIPGRKDATSMQRFVAAAKASEWI